MTLEYPRKARPSPNGDRKAQAQVLNQNRNFACFE